MTGLVVDGSGFELVVGGERVGSRRVLGSTDVAFLEGLAARYVRAVQAGSDGGLLGLGRELFGWLDGESGLLGVWLERVVAPVVLEVRGPQWPSAAAWAVLRAPFELLAWPEGGFLAESGLMRFGVVRRLGAPSHPVGLDGFRLGVAFMASSPVGAQELDFEAEELAILDAVGDARIDLLVEDTGDPTQLGERLAGARLPVVHLSCHGLNTWSRGDGEPGRPVLLMEDDAGGPRPTTAPELVGLLPADSTRLVFVSACLTATGADTAHLPAGSDGKGGAGPGGRAELLAHSLSTELIAAGVPAVIGWDGSIVDRAATAFAERLYRGLADRGDVAVAVADARRTLLRSDDPVLRAGWHMARLWCGPTGGGPVVAGGRKRSLVSAVHGTKRFLDRKHQVPVARAQMFVGRRDELRRALRALRGGERAGVLLHGQGRLGKSSLAARIADRMSADHAVAVVFGDYSPLAVLDAIADAVRTNPAARDLVHDKLPVVRERPEAIGEVLVDLLSGPCAQAGDGRKPLLLVIDDLEQILEHDPAGPHRVSREHALTLAAVLGAFDPGETDSRLLLTSRFTFTLDGAETVLQPIHLRPLSTAARRKLHRRHQGLAPAHERDERGGLAGRAVAVSRGNPGLQDLICLRLVYNEAVPLARAQAAVTEMEGYLDQGDLPTDSEVREFLENLALDALLEETDTAELALLRAVTLFDLPVPEPVVAALAENVGGTATRLGGLGLLEPYPDPAGATALAVNPLAAGRIPLLTPAERSALATITVHALFAAWSPPTSASRSTEQDLQLARLAILADNPAITATCAATAVHHLRTGHAADAAALGHEAITLLDRHHQPIPLLLLRVTADAALTSGDGPLGQALLDRAAHHTTIDDHANTLDRARVIAEQAQHLITTGQPAKAEHLLRQAHHLFTTAGSELEAATAMGRVGGIAYQQGDYEEASDLQLRRLEVNRQLGDLDGIAAANWALAQIDLDQQDYSAAIPRIIESHAILRQLQRPDGIAIVGATLAQIVTSAGDTEQARHIAEESLNAAMKINSPDLVEQLRTLLDRITQGINES
ncbi:CHAT domain-containing protein [Actinokineospora sp. NPDC004072]